MKVEYQGFSIERAGREFAVRNSHGMLCITFTSFARATAFVDRLASKL